MLSKKVTYNMKHELIHWIIKHETNTFVGSAIIIIVPFRTLKVAAMVPPSVLALVVFLQLMLAATYQLSQAACNTPMTSF